MGEGGVLHVLARTGYVILLCCHIAWICIGAVITTCVQVGPQDIKYVKKHKSDKNELQYAVEDHLYPPAICHDVKQSEAPRHLQSRKRILIKVPLTCKIFIVEKGSILLVEKLRGTLSCEQWLHGEKFEDLVAKICRFVISDVIKTGLSPVRRDVTRGTEVDG